MSNFLGIVVINIIQNHSNSHTHPNFVSVPSKVIKITLDNWNFPLKVGVIL